MKKNEKAVVLFSEGRKQCGECHAWVARRVAAKLSGINDYSTYIKEEFSNLLSEKEMSNISSANMEKLMSIFESDR